MGAVIQLQAQAVKRNGDHCLRTVMPLVGTGKVGELHIAMAGEWKGHPAGEFEFSEAIFDEMIAAFAAQKTPLLIDYEHAAPNGDTRAAGWIHGLEKRRGEDGQVQLWANPVEWTDAAAGMIKAGEYRFCSPWFAKSTTDRQSGDKTGPRLLNVALTNLPFLDGQSPIKLSFVCAVNAADAEPPPPAQPATAPSSEDAAAAEAQALSEQLTAFIDAVAKGAGVNRAAAVAGLNDMTDQITGQLREHLDADGVPQEQKPMEPKDTKPAADADQAKKDAIEASARANDGTIALSRIEELSTKLSAIESERAAEKAAAEKAKETANATRVDGMVACGALLDSEKGTALWLLSTDAGRFEEVYGPRMKNKAVPIGTSQAGIEPIDPAKATPADLTEDEAGAYHLLCAQPGWTSEKAVQRLVARRGKTKGAARAATKVG